MATLVFSKILTKTDVESYLSISTCSIGQLPFEEGQLVNMHVQDHSSQEWIFACSIQEDENNRCFLSVGWTDFANQKGVRVGDQIIIHEEVMNKHQSNSATWMKIEVQRKIRLFGVDIWANV